MASPSVIPGASAVGGVLRHADSSGSAAVEARAAMASRRVMSDWVTVWLRWIVAENGETASRRGLAASRTPLAPSTKCAVRGCRRDPFRMPGRRLVIHAHGSPMLELNLLHCTHP